MHLYIVYEDSHGDISYWTDEAAAIEEVKKIIISGWPAEELLAAQNKYKNTSNPNRWYELFCDEVFYRKVELNKSWR